MFALERILVPTNLGEPSKAAIRYGVAFARQFGAKLYLAHVLPARDFEAAIEAERVIEKLLPAATEGADRAGSATAETGAAREFAAHAAVANGTAANGTAAGGTSAGGITAGAANAGDAARSGEPDPESVLRNAAREDLGQLLDEAEERDTRAEYLLRSAGAGGAGDAIVACAEELGVELIVMGKHRLGFVEHLLAGSVTEKVVRRAPCPVLIVHYPEHEFLAEDESE